MQNDKSPYYKLRLTTGQAKFKINVYGIVKNIPAGKIMTYKQIAEAVGKPRAWRAVGNILAKNYNPNIPCHRIIRSDGKLGGYNRGPKNKAFLLKQEKAIL